MKLASQGAQYAISAIIAISKHKNDVISASELSHSLNCPAAYLSQILAKLKAPGILKSQRGLNGGVYLAKALEDISVYDVIAAIDGETFFSTCFMGIEGCGHIEEDESLDSYDDRNFHDNVIPRMKCPQCGKSTLDLGLKPEFTQTKYSAYEVV